MTVQMHGVGGWELVLHDYPHGAVVAEIVDVPLRVVGVREIALIGKDQDWMA